MWRVQSFGSVDDAIKFIRCCQSSRTATKQSSRANVSRETGVSAKARPRSAASSGDSATLPALPTQMRDQERQRCRRDAVDAAGVADGARPVRLQLVADLVGQSWQRRIVEILGQSHAFIAAIRLDVGGLATEINLVFGIDLELLGDLGRQLAKARPDPCHIADADIRIRQHLERRAALTVLAQGEAMPRGFAWRDDKLTRHDARSIEPRHLGAMRPRPYRAD